LLAKLRLFITNWDEVIVAHTVSLEIVAARMTVSLPPNFLGTIPQSRPFPRKHARFGGTRDRRGRAGALELFSIGRFMHSTGF
jgi:hypothetical protein